MTVKKHIARLDDGIDRGICLVEGESSSGSTGKGTFEWDEELQGIILGAFFWGYVSRWYLSKSFKFAKKLHEGNFDHENRNDFRRKF